MFAEHFTLVIFSGLAPNEARHEPLASGPAPLLAGAGANLGSSVRDVKIGSYRSLLRTLSAKSGSAAWGGSGSAGPTAEHKSGDISGLVEISFTGEDEEQQPQLIHLNGAHVLNSSEYAQLSPFVHILLQVGSDFRVCCGIVGRGFLYL